MDEYNASSFANRGDAIPVISFPKLDDETPSPGEGSQKKMRKREKWKSEAEKLREKLHDVNSQYKASQGSMQERLFNTYGHLAV